MKFSQSFLPALSLVVAAQASWNQTYAATTVTITTDVYTTFCPEATTFSYGTKTYTATKSETITITDCPCTLTTTGYPSIGPPKQPSATPAPPTYPVYPPTSPESPSNVTYPAFPPEVYSTIEAPPSYTTKTIVVSSYETYCPSSTTFTEGSKTYTVTEPTTLTIPCPPYTVITTETHPSIATPTPDSPSVPNGPHSNPGGPIKNSTETVHVSTYPVWSVSTISELTTYCPEPTTLTLSSYVYTLPSGTNTLPIITYVPIPPTSVGTSSAIKVPVGPTAATTSLPVYATGAAEHLNAGAFVAGAVGVVALLL